MDPNAVKITLPAIPSCGGRGHRLGGGSGGIVGSIISTGLELQTCRNKMMVQTVFLKFSIFIQLPYK